MTQVALTFTSADTLPDVQPGNMKAIIILNENEEGRRFCFAGYYLNKYTLDFDDDGESNVSGWFYDESNFEYEHCYWRVSGKIIAWSPMPTAQSVTEALS